MADNFITNSNLQDLEVSDQTANEAYTQIAPSTGRAITEGAAALESPVRDLYKAAQRGAYATSSFFDRFMALSAQGGNVESGIPESQYTPEIKTKTISGKEANAQYSPPQKKLFNDDQQIDEGLAQLVGKQATDDYQREDLLNRYTNQHSWPINFGVETAGFLMDPLNVGSMFVPGVGSEWILGRVGAETGFMGRVAARAALGASEAATGQVPLVGLKYGLSQEEAQDYDLYSAFKDLSMAALPGAVFRNMHGVLSELGVVKPDEALEDVEKARQQARLDETKKQVMSAMVKIFNGKTNTAALKSSISQFIEGKSTDITPILNLRIRDMVLKNTQNSNAAYDALRQITDKFHENPEQPMASEDLETLLSITKYIQKLDQENASLVAISDGYPKTERTNPNVRISELEGHFKRLYEEFGYGKEGFKWGGEAVTLANQIADKMEDLKSNPRQYLQDVSSLRGRTPGFYKTEEQRFFNEQISEHLQQQYPYDSPEHLSKAISETYKHGFDVGLTDKEITAGKNTLDSVSLKTSSSTPKSQVNNDLAKTVTDIQDRIKRQESELMTHDTKGENVLDIQPEDLKEITQSDEEINRMKLDEKGLNQAAGCLKDAGI